jgi:predicted RNA-binding Zn ribbon-like protein
MISQGTAPAESFSFRSDRLCLDFAATLMFRDAAQPKELLDSPARLSAWALASGVVSGPIPCSPNELGDATELREAIYRLAVALITRRLAKPDELAVLNRHGQLAPVAVALSPDGTITRSGPMMAVLASIARDAIELLGGPDAQSLRQCGRDGCTRMFVDRSHGRNRTWCGMRVCGNRVNAAAYRRRKHQKQGNKQAQPSTYREFM